MRAAGDVPAGIVLVAPLDLRGRHDAPREDALAEARRKALELGLHALGHVDGRAVRDVAIHPRGLLAARRARRIEQALLADEHERPRRYPAPRHRVLAGRDLVEGPAEVDGARAQALRRPPGDRSVERVVDLEDARSAAIAAQLRAIA